MSRPTNSCGLECTWCSASSRLRDQRGGLVERVLERGARGQRVLQERLAEPGEVAVVLAAEGAVLGIGGGHDRSGVALQLIEKHARVARRHDDHAPADAGRIQRLRAAPPGASCTRGSDAVLTSRPSSGTVRGEEQHAAHPPPRSCARRAAFERLLEARDARQRVRVAILDVVDEQHRAPPEPKRAPNTSAANSASRRKYCLIAVAGEADEIDAGRPARARRDALPPPRRCAPAGRRGAPPPPRRRPRLARLRSSATHRRVSRFRIRAIQGAVRARPGPGARRGRARTEGGAQHPHGQGREVDERQHRDGDGPWRATSGRSPANQKITSTQGAAASAGTSSARVSAARLLAARRGRRRTSAEQQVTRPAEQAIERELRVPLAHAAYRAPPRRRGSAASSAAS